LIVVVDDATKRILHAELWEGGESVAAVMSALYAVVQHYGVPMVLYTDRAHWAAHTPPAGGPPDRRRLTQVGRALARLGIEHILAYSPAARGRSERVNRTLQDRLVNEWRVAGITTVAAANRYLREQFLPAFNVEFGRAPTESASAFVPARAASISSTFSASKKSASSAATMSSPPRVSRFSSPSSPVAAPAPASRCGCAATSTVSIPFGMVRGASAATTGTADP
jgi:hypothetical protein